MVVACSSLVPYAPKLCALDGHSLLILSKHEQEKQAGQAGFERRRTFKTQTAVVREMTAAN